MSNRLTDKLIPVAARFCLLVAAILSAACVSAPNTALLQAREAYKQAQADPEVSRNAPVALHEAEQSLALAGQSQDKDEINHLAYIAKRRVDIARAEAQTRIAEESSKQQFKAREGMRVRSLEQDKARSGARMKNLEEELAALKATKTERGYVITLGDVLFDYNRANLKADAQQNLYPLATFLNDFPEKTIAIEGHTDSTGTASYNLELSEFRAQSVEGFLRENGVQAERISTQGFGLTRPVASNANTEGRQQNRRVEVIISN